MRTSISLLLLLAVAPFLTVCRTDVSINTTQTIRDGDFLVSSNGRFKLGFFSPGNSKNGYIGISYRQTDSTVVWVANRDSPLTNTTGAVLKVIKPGILVILNASNSVVWTSNTSLPRGAREPVVELLDSGNLVVKEAKDDDPDNYIWQSFDYPTDTTLPGMKLGKIGNGLEIFLSSWKSNDDPGTGDYSLHLVTNGYPYTVLRKGSTVLFRTGPWNGVTYSGERGFRNNSMYQLNMVINPDQVYFQFNLLNSSAITRFVLNYTGNAQRLWWNDLTQGWKVVVNLPSDLCDNYQQCGPYSTCDLDSTSRCSCLPKFVPTKPNVWATGDWANGCERRTPLNCQTDGFIKYSDVKPPDSQHSWYNTTMTLAECQHACLRNCSCMAYKTLDVRNAGSGCLLWFGNLVDFRNVEGLGQDMYIRVAYSDSDHGTHSKTSARKVDIIVSLVSVGGVILLGCFIIYVHNRKKVARGLTKGLHRNDDDKDLELPLFEFGKISRATKNFSDANKLGEGGFGPVYKGTLEDGQEVAIKRLSKTSSQGLDEFKNEVICIARLQHRNLVKLLGCCIEGGEKMLIYEYMPNRSLDLIIFNEKKSKQLDLPRRLQIINGIARGLMYLHQDSRLRIIHRDLKVSNILLDSDLNPRISDFGMARSFGGNETEANTNRIVGTYGYMSPEYTIDGVFSVKSDVYSFGVIVLETLSGERNRGFSHKTHHHNLLGHAWKLHKEEMSLELVEETLRESGGFSEEIIKTIHVGLLCVQAYPDDRPSMSMVVNMLENEFVLPQPKEPGFFTERDAYFNDFSISTKGSTSTSGSTITKLHPR